MPWATPPWTWPARISGLMTVPQSCTTTYLSTLSAKVCGSTSTIMAWAPFAVVPLGGPKYCVDSSPGSVPGRTAHRIGLERQRAELDRLAGNADDRNLAVGDLQVLFGAFEMLGGELEDLLP